MTVVLPRWPTLTLILKLATKSAKQSAESQEVLHSLTNQALAPVVVVVVDQTAVLPAKFEFVSISGSTSLSELCGSFVLCSLGLCIWKKFLELDGFLNVLNFAVFCWWKWEEGKVSFLVSARSDFTCHSTMSSVRLSVCLSVCLFVCLSVAGPPYPLPCCPFPGNMISVQLCQFFATFIFRKIVFQFFQVFLIHFWMFYAILGAQKNFHNFFSPKVLIFELWVKQGATQCYQAF